MFPITTQHRASTRSRIALPLATAATVMLALVGCAPGPDDDGATDSHLIIAMMGFPCGLNSFATALCDGFESAGENLPDGYELQIKTGIDYSDNTGYNNLIRTSLQLEPAGIIVFPGGSAAQAPVLKQACEQGVKVIIIDTPVADVDCASSFIGADHLQLGIDAANWLIDNPPATTEVGIVSLPPGQTPSNDARVKGFTDTVTEAGFEVVATAVTDLSLDKTRTEVTNMLTAHPGIGAVFSANDAMGDGAAQAITDPDVVQLSLDGSLTSVERIVAGTLSADVAQDPFGVGQLSVETMVKVLEGESVPAEVYSDSLVVDATNVEEYIEAGGVTH